MLNKYIFNLALVIFICSISIESLAIVRTANLKGGWRLEEGSGASAADLSGNGNTGTLLNTPTWTTGKLGRGLLFNGTNEYVTIPNSASLNIAGQVTYAAWVKPSAFPAGIHSIYIKGQGPGIENYIRLNSSILEVGVWNGATDFRTQFDISAWIANEWHHVVGLYDGSNWVLYVDGIQRSSTASATGALATATGAGIGGWPGGGRYFLGSIDEIRVYNRALNSSEIRSLMLGFEPGEY